MIKSFFVYLGLRNGSGKSTLLKTIVGIFVPQSGSVRHSGKSVGYIPQDLNTYFYTDTVFEEINQSIKGWSLGSIKDRKTYWIKLNIEPLKDRHPL